jgi:hypothetical protein
MRSAAQLRSLFVSVVLMLSTPVLAVAKEQTSPKPNELEVLQSIDAHVEQTKFLIHAGAFTLGILFGMMSWSLALRAMRESDF